MSLSPSASLMLVLTVCACGRKSTPGDPMPAPSATAPTDASTVVASPVSTASPAPAPSVATNCYTAVRSRDYGSRATAEPPFGECAKQLKVHCGGKDGTRGGLTGLPLDVTATVEARRKQTDACCYASCD